VLFVCTANICRSPSMQLLATSMTRSDELQATSAGTHGFVDHPVDEVVNAALPQESRDEGFCSRRLTKEMLEDADLVVTAEASHRSFVLEEHPAIFRKVFTLGQLAAAVAKADPELHGEELLTQIGTQRGSAESELDVADPYRRGPEAAQVAVQQIEELLRGVLPRLVRSRTIS